MSSVQVNVLIDDRQQEEVNAEQIMELARRVAEAEGVAGEISLTLVDSREMAELNSAYRGLEGPTDVLSFPVDGRCATSDAAGSPPVLIGEVVICPQVAKQSTGVTLSEEVELLVVHGVLHLIGYDHGTKAEAKVMAEREFDLLGRSGAQA